jgi:hypothetical protein
MTGDLFGWPRVDFVWFAGLLLVVAWAVWYYHSHAPEDNDD